MYGYGFGFASSMVGGAGEGGSYSRVVVCILVHVVKSRCFSRVLSRCMFRVACASVQWEWVLT